MTKRPPPTLTTLLPLLLATLTIALAAACGNGDAGTPSSQAPTLLPTPTKGPPTPVPTHSPVIDYQNPLFRTLSFEEQDCLTRAAPPEMAGDPSQMLGLPPGSPGVSDTITCLSPESLEMLLTTQIQPGSQATADAVLACLSQQNVGTQLKQTGDSTARETGAMIQAAALTLSTCLFPGQWADTNLPQDQLGQLRCMAERGTTPDQLAGRTVEDNREDLTRCISEDEIPTNPNATLTPPPTGAGTGPTPQLAPLPTPSHPLYALLTAPERRCLDDAAEGDPSDALRLRDHAPDTRPALRCLSAANVTRLMAHEITGHIPSLNPVATACLASENIAEQAAAALPPTGRSAPPASFLLMLPAQFVLAQCVTPEQWTDLNYPPGQNRLLQCVAEEGVNTKDLILAAVTEDPTLLGWLEQISRRCAATRAPVQATPPAIQPGTAIQDHPLYETAAGLVRRYTGSQPPPTLVSATPYTWGNGAMGCAKAGMAYTAAEIRGHVLLLVQAGNIHQVHSNQRGTIMFVVRDCLGGPEP